MTRFLPAWLTAHRAVLLGLVALVICAFVVSAVDAEFAPRPDALVLSLVLVVVVTGAVTYLGAAIVRVPPNSDSWLITALILFFVLPGAADSASVTTVIVGSAVAAASKYVLVWRRRLIVNPAAAGAVVCYGLGYAGVGSIGFPTWWIAAQPMLIPMVVIGVVVVTALYEWPLVATFLVAALVTIGVVALIDGTGDLSLWLISSPMFFAATFMLPEPLTSPSTRVHRLIYGALVGVLMYCQQSIPVTDAFTLEFVPEIALLIGCLYAFIVRLSAGTARRIPLDVSSVDALAEHTFGVRLAADGGAPRFRPGQWATLSAPRWSAPLWNSSRRVLSFANAPGARATEFAFTTGAGPSPYKGALIDGSTSRVWIDNIGGDFVTGSDAVPGDHDIVLFASGIGITPFLSMLRTASSTGEDLSAITLVHALRADGREVYADVLEGMRRQGVRVVVTIDSDLASGHADPQRLADLLAVDTHDRPVDYYLSGRPDFVERIGTAIKAADPHARKIRTDSFLGY